MLLLLLLSLIPQGADQRITAVRGQVFAADTGAPLRHAYVLMRGNGPGAGQETFTAKTDSTGAYEFRNLQPGRYSATAAKPGFTNATYRNQDDVTQVTVAAGQVTAGIDIKLPRAVVISGAAIDINGEPVVGASVQAMQKVYRQGQVELQGRGSGQTDDHGEYRIHGIPAGRYYVQAFKRGSSGFGGGPGYAPETFPQPVRLAAGEERKGVNFTLRDAVGYSISGKVFDTETGQPMPNVFIYVNPEGSQGGSNGNTQTRPDGTFRITDLSPGHYRMGGNSMQMGPPPAAMPGQAGAPVRVPPRTFTRSFDLEERDITDMTIRLGPGIKVKGSVRAEGGFVPTRLQVQLLARNPNGGVYNSFGGPTTPEGTFEIPNIQPGTYEVSIFSNNGASAASGDAAVGSFFVSAVNGSSELTFAIPDGATSAEVLTTIDFRVGAITGKTFAAGETAGETADKLLPGTFATLISADPKKRLSDRYFKRYKSGRDGVFKFNAIIPGDYFLVIWPGDDPGQVLDPEVFAMLEKHLVKVTVGPNGKIAQDLRLTPELRAISDAFAQ